MSKKKNEISQNEFKVANEKIKTSVARTQNHTRELLELMTRSQDFSGSLLESLDRVRSMLPEIDKQLQDFRAIVARRGESYLTEQRQKAIDSFNLQLEALRAGKKIVVKKDQKDRLTK